VVQSQKCCHESVLEIKGGLEIDWLTLPQYHIAHLVNVETILILNDKSSFLWIQTSRMVICGTFVKNSYLRTKLPYGYGTKYYFTYSKWDYGIGPWVFSGISPKPGFFFRMHATRKHPKKFPYYKRYKISRNFLDEKAKCQPWVIKVRMKKPKLDENRIKIGENFILHP
jgi:hypothetical protein